MILVFAFQNNNPHGRFAWLGCRLVIALFVCGFPGSRRSDVAEAKNEEQKEDSVSHRQVSFSHKQDQSGTGTCRQQVAFIVSCPRFSVSGAPDTLKRGHQTRAEWCRERG